MRTGYATLTATTQYFLDTCPAVKSWTASEDEKTATFIYDESVEVALVPDGVDFAEMKTTETATRTTVTKPNPISIQDSYIKRVAPLDPKSRNYVVNVSKAWKWAIAAIMDFGFTENCAHRMVCEAHDLAQLERFWKARNRNRNQLRRHHDETV